MFENILIYGPSGSGKSTFLHSFIKDSLNNKTIDDVRLVLVDSKIINFYQYQDNEFLLFPIITNEEDLISKINLLIEEVKRRKELKTNKEPNILVVIDEYSDIETTATDEALLSLLKEGHNYGVYVILATQSINEDIFDSNLLKKFNRI